MHSQRFAYQVVEIKGGFWGLKPQRLQDELNRLGAQGWELVSVLQSNPLHSVRLFLKRVQ
jgi:hypothetical protein